MNLQQKAWEQLKKVYLTLKENKIPSADYSVLGYVESCPKGQFAINKKDLDTVLTLFPFAKKCIVNEYEKKTILYIEYKELMAI